MSLQKSSQEIQRWEKCGLVITPESLIKNGANPDWVHSHVAVPSAEPLNGFVYRVYFCCRDAQNRSQIGFADVDIREPEKILNVSENPILGLGPLGSFDDNGVTATWILNRSSKKYLYYVGWNKGTTVRMHLFAGLAISEDGGKTFERYSNAPILERVKQDPYLTATVSVLEENGVYRMWYVSGDKWMIWGDESIPKYNIKYAESKDGIHWNREAVVCVDNLNDKEHSLARPCVLKENGIYKMWYSYKGQDYRIGYAESYDGLKWTRLDDRVQFLPSEGNFDSQMQEYSFVISHQQKKVMLYNGNEYGKHGICFARLVS
jgi:hypothetical protein